MWRPPTPSGKQDGPAFHVQCHPDALLDMADLPTASHKCHVLPPAAAWRARHSSSWACWTASAPLERAKKSPAAGQCQMQQ